MATLKNKFSAKFKSDSPLEIIANELATSLENHPKFDAKKANKDINLLSARTLESFIQNIRSFLVMLDNGQQHGPFATMGWEPLQGMGQFEGPYGIISRAKMGASIRESVKKYRKKYGKVLADLGVQKVFVEEYKDIAALENGKLTKLDLYRMQALTGTAHNIAILQNLGVDIATIRAVNEKHLSKELFDIIQELHWGTFAKLRPLAFNEHELRTGEKPTAQESVSFEAFGQTYPGGYHHLVTKRDTEAAFLKARHEEMEASFGGTERVKLPFRSTVQSYVRSPHTINVVDHDLIPDLDVDMFAVGVENTIYALTMSNPVRDVITLFTHPELAQAIRSVSGPEQYRTFINNLQATTLSMQTHNEMQHSMQQRAFGEFVGKHLVTPFYLAVAAFSPAIAVKHLGLFEVARQIMGSGGTKHLTFAVGHWLKLWNLNKWSEMNKFISSAVPGHMDWSSGMSKTDSVLRDLNPKDYKYQNKPWKVMADVQEYLAHAGVHGFLGGLLHLTQNIVATAAMNQYLAGEAPGGPTKEQLDTMSDADVIREAKAYMGSVTVASSIEPQKTGKTTLNQIPIMKEAGRFTSITQNILNFINQRARNIHSDAKGGEKAWREGNYEESYAKFASSGQKTMNLFLFFMIMKMIENKGTGKQAFATDQNDKNKEEDLEGLLKFATHYTSLDGSLGLGELAVTGTVGMAPMGRNVIWAAEKGNGFGEVTMPFLSAVSTYGGAAKTLLMVPESLSFLDYIDRLSWYEYQQVAIAGSMITGMPLYAAMSMMKKTDNGQGPRRIEVAGDIVLGGALMAVDAFAGKHGTKTDKQKMQEIIDRRNEAKSQTATPTPTPTSSNEPKDKMQFVADAAVKTVENVIPKSTPSPLKIRGFNEKEYYEVVAQAESGDGKSMGSKGNWEATKRWMKTKNRPRGEWVGKPGVTEDRAYGPFQFMAKTWRGVVESVEGKAAGLTINGRFDDVQQLAAMKILTAQNIRSLKSNGIPITDQSVYAAHHFGDRVAAQTYATDAKDSDLLPSWVITKKVAKRNKDVADAETVGDLKEYIISRLGDGITKREAALKEDKNYQDVIKRTEILAAGRYKHEPAKQKPTVVRGRGR